MPAFLPACVAIGVFSYVSSRSASTYRLSTLSTAVPNWRAGDTIPLGRRTLRVVGLRDDDDADLPPILIVDDVAE
jgi:hypothetical protein